MSCSKNPIKLTIIKNYDLGAHIFHYVRNTLPGKNDLFNAYNTIPDKNGNIMVTFSVEDPKDGTYWMPVNKEEAYYYVVRYYKPDVAKLPPKPCK